MAKHEDLGVHFATCHAPILSMQMDQGAMPSTQDCTNNSSEILKTDGPRLTTKSALQNAAAISGIPPFDLFLIEKGSALSVRRAGDK